MSDLLNNGRTALINAPAKINLSLHIEGRRADGYHQLSGLVAFADVGDELHFEVLNETSRPADQKSTWSLDTVGPFADQLAAPCSIASENLVSKAARLFCAQAGECPSGAIRLVKNLPIAAGIGGGSADAAATLMALQKICNSPLDDDELAKIALKLGADVPMCLTPTAQLIAGIGEICQPVKGLAPLPCVLVNPGVGVATAQVFRDLGASLLREDYMREQIALPDLRTPATIIDWLHKQRNDLQAPATRTAPIIGDVLAELARDKHCRLARMSGSGATCFGLYDSEQTAREAAQEISAEHPDWWVVATVLK